MSSFKKLMPNSNNDVIATVYLIVTLILSFWIRLWWINNINTEQLYDFATYQMLAENIANGYGHTMNGVPVAWQGSGYPYFLGYFYKIIGNTSVYYGQILNLLLSELTIILSFFIYKKMFERLWLVLLATTMLAFFPHYIAYVNVIGTEIFFTTILALIITTQLYYKDSTKLMVLGVLIGMGTLVKPFMLVYPVIYAVSQWVMVDDSQKKDLKRIVLNFSSILLISMLVISPWTYRNYKLFGRVIPVSYNSGYVLYINNNDNNVNGSWMDLHKATSSEDMKKEIDGYLQNGDRSIKEAYDIEPILKDSAKEWISSNPKEFVKLGILRLKQTFFAGANDIFQWSLNSMEVGDKPPNEFNRNVNTLNAIFSICVYVCSSAGVIFLLGSFWKYTVAFFSFTKRVDILTAITFINIAFFVVITFVFEGQARYAFPVYLFFIPCIVKLLGLVSKE